MNKEVLIEAIEEVLQEFKEPVYIEKISDCCGIGSTESTRGHVVLDDGSFSNLTYDIAAAVLKLQPTLKESEWVSVSNGEIEENIVAVREEVNRTMTLDEYPDAVPISKKWCLKVLDTIIQNMPQSTERKEGE